MHFLSFRAFNFLMMVSLSFFSYLKQSTEINKKRENLGAGVAWWYSQRSSVHDVAVSIPLILKSSCFDRKLTII